MTSGDVGFSVRPELSANGILAVRKSVARAHALV
jgi:hypothetical protein